jgi:hypothetical protein
MHEFIKSNVLKSKLGPICRMAYSNSIHDSTVLKHYGWSDEWRWPIQCHALPNLVAQWPILQSLNRILRTDPISRSQNTKLSIRRTRPKFVSNGASILVCVCNFKYSVTVVHYLQQL